MVNVGDGHSVWFEQDLPRRGDYTGRGARLLRPGTAQVHVSRGALRPAAHAKRQVQGQRIHLFDTLGISFVSDFLISIALLYLLLFYFISLYRHCFEIRNIIEVFLYRKMLVLRKFSSIRTRHVAVQIVVSE